jgi:acyl transferase domain-containing protein/acyl carrier protein
LAKWLPDGNIEFLGRMDNQVKIRGYRIEICEIESILLQHKAVNEAVVLDKTDSGGNKYLCAYIVINEYISKSDLRVYLANYVPDYMIPAYFVYLDNIPLSQNGKIDRRALREINELEGAGNKNELPLNELEEKVLKVWKSILPGQNVGITDNFFEVGGHSLKLIQVHNELIKLFNTKLTVIEMYRYPTVRSLAQYLNAENSGKLTEDKETSVKHETKNIIEKYNSDIAIIGMSGRFPKARDVDDFWRNILEGTETISFFNNEELETNGVPSSVLNDPGYVKAGGTLEDIELFDADFFSISAREAGIMDPQQRLFLECSYEALENAGYSGKRYGRATGVFACSSMGSYLLNFYQDKALMGSVDYFQAMLANDKDFLATRVCYKLDLNGPGVTVQTACSSSLVAVHSACKSLLAKECNIALAGGVSIKVPHKTGYFFKEGGILSPDGHCRAFDAKARGTVGGNGLGIVVLKRLTDAIRDRDNIYAVIKGSAINNDGSAKVSYTAPSVDGQAAVIVEAMANAGVDPGSITYIEAHGTGTEMGDPIEVAALTKAFRRKTGKKQYCAIGSVKTNIGHLDAAAGVAGLIKTSLCLKHGRIPASLNFESPNPKIDFDSSPFYVNRELKEWESEGTPRRAGVSSFGIGGTNAHIIMEEAPLQEPSGRSRPWQLLLISAKTEEALEAATVNLADCFEKNPGINIADAAYTLKVGRRVFGNRRTIICRDSKEAVEIIKRKDPGRMSTLRDENEDRPVVFMFPGQGAQYIDMAKALYEEEKVFKDEVDRCAEFIHSEYGINIKEIIYPVDSDKDTMEKRLERTHFAQLAIFIVECAMAKLWMEWGIKPHSMIGHSIGEYTAAHIAGVFTLEEALRLIEARGRLMQEQPEGSMTAVALDERELAGLPGDRLSVAAVNAPGMCVVSGIEEEVSRLEEYLKERGIFFTRLRTSHGFHSHMMEPVIDSFVQEMSKVKLKAPKIPFISCATGTWITPEEAVGPEYWGRQLRKAVRFGEGIKEVLKEKNAILLEVGPGNTLCTLARKNGGSRMYASMRCKDQQQDDAEFLLHTVGNLWLSGARLEWDKYYKTEIRRRIPLPAYPFQRQRYWIEGADTMAEMKEGDCDAGEIKKLEIDNWFYIPSWRKTLPLGDWKDKIPAGEKNTWLIFEDEFSIGRYIKSKLNTRQQEVFLVIAGGRFGKKDNFTYTVNPASQRDYYSLIQDLIYSGKFPRKIIHLWGVHPGKDICNEDKNFNQAQTYGFYSIMYLTRALEREAKIPVRICVVTSGVHEVTGQEVLEPEKATVLGINMVIRQENPNIICHNVDITMPTTEELSKKSAERLISECLLSHSDHIAAYRSNHRWVSCFEKVNIKSTGEKPALLREKGVYLITGGLGRIGLVLAEYLAKEVNARLILVGRTEFPHRDEWDQWILKNGLHDDISEKILKLRNIENCGAQILVMNGDVSDSAFIDHIANDIGAEFGKIHGIIHAAGISGIKAHKMISNSTREECDRQFLAKARGTMILAKAVDRFKPDFMILVSSIATVLGGIGFSAYSAANSYMNAFSHKYNRDGAMPVISICLDAWEMVQNRDGKTYGTDLETLAITSGEGVEVIKRILSIEAVPQIVISTGDLYERIKRWVGFEAGKKEKKGGSLTSVSPRPNLHSEYIAPRNDLEEKVSQIWQEMLGVDKVGIHDNFFELGGNSLIGVDIISRINKELQTDISIVTLFEAPTIGDIAGLLSPNGDNTDEFGQIHKRGEKRRLRQIEKERSI